ncbi:hypothetical protein BH10ACT3_BH10ACT3_21100 [soil metagenome]
MLIGYVSDEWDMAIVGALLELEGASGQVVNVSSSPTGAVRADVAPGSWTVTLHAAGHGPKQVQVELVEGAPIRFRLLSERLYGYVWPKWTTSGGTGELCVHAPIAHHVSLWRYGWKRELVSHIGDFDDHPPGSLAQMLPDGDVAALGARWNRTGYATPAVDPRIHQVAPAEHGLHLVHVETADGRSTSFPWVVAPAAPRHRIAVLTSSLSWNAYNDFGGRSNYVSAQRLPATPTVTARQDLVWFSDPEHPPWVYTDYDPLSFNRPEPVNEVPLRGSITDPIDVRGGEHVAPAEWRLIGWMEREGFDHDVYADAQLDEGGLDLDAYDIVIISTHPEYWTTAMLDTLQSWVTERGGKLAYLGGNGIHGPVRIDGDLMTCLNGDSFDGGPSRMEQLHRSEAELLGVQTTFSGYETGAPYRVVDADHWIFDGTGLANGDLFGSESLDRRAVGGASGHETDKWTADTPPGARLLAKGTNPDDGGGEMTAITFDGGGEVFSVGSISYTCAIAVDPDISQITAKLLTRWLGPPAA